MTGTLSKENIPPSVGQILKSSRLEQGLTLEQISKNLCINKRQLSSLEEDVEHLICDVYTLGFVKLYAQYLELNVQEILEAFKTQTSQGSHAPPLIFPAPLPGRGIPSYRILALSLLGLVAIIIGWKWVNHHTSAPFPYPRSVTTNSKPKMSPPLPTQQKASTNLPIKRDIAPLNDRPSHLEVSPPQVNLRITEKAWIEVKDEEGNTIVNRLFKPGDSFDFKNSENLILKTGNIKGTHLSSGEKNFPTSGNSGEVKGNIPLDPKKWLE